MIIETLPGKPMAEQRIEIVERKGLGHPDNICDAIMERVSVELCKEYIKRVGVVLHHNIDKALLSAGEVETKFGGGVVKKPMLLVIGDRATFKAGELEFPVERIAVDTAKRWFKQNFRFLDPDEHVRYQVELKAGSAALRDIFKRGGEVLGANDTSAAVGYAPLSPTERLVLETERFLNSRGFKREFPESGEDVKVMASRVDNRVELTIAMAFVDRFIDSEQSYFGKKEEILERLGEFLKQRNELEVGLHLNTLDRPGRGVSGVYLTVLGTCADGADCGQVGRGNRINGIIPLNRPSTSEAACGKNPVSHVGKIYNALTFKIAEDIHERIGVKEVYVWLVSQIGKPIDQPLSTIVQVIPPSGLSLDDIKPEIEEVVRKDLEGIGGFCKELAMGKVLKY
jgi:S-adenosylmethionine synthetase